ncbi:MAG: MATE family efflux transporter, partial [Candidatus Eisenbacteria bacterium]|nr:MATE family efflux transporter [Candidatus Eisenbacteria bacterium]
LHQFFFGLHRPKIITVSAILGNITNGLANYVFIFGREGMPQFGLPGIPGIPPLGVRGAALGTVLGTAVELLVPACVFLGAAMNRELRSRAAWRPAAKPLRDLLALGWPPAVQYGNELVCWSIFMTVLVGRFGPDHMTAGWITLSYMHLSFMPAVGFSVAVTSLVGKYIGAGQPDTAVSRARLGLYLAMGYMTACGIGFVVFRHSLIGAFVGGDVTPERAAAIASIGGSLLLCAAVFQMADAVGIIYTGALRGAGDTKWPGIVTMIYSWAFIVAGGMAMIRLLPRLTSTGPWIASAVYIIVLGITMGKRFESGHWRSIKLLDTRISSGAVVPTPPGLEAEETGL